MLFVVVVVVAVNNKMNKDTKSGVAVAVLLCMLLLRLRLFAVAVAVAVAVIVVYCCLSYCRRNKWFSITIKKKACPLIWFSSRYRATTLAAADASYYCCCWIDCKSRPLTHSSSNIILGLKIDRCTVCDICDLMDFLPRLFLLSSLNSCSWLDVLVVDWFRSLTATPPLKDYFLSINHH